MKRFISSLCALSILFACTQEEPAPIRVESIELDSEELELIEGNSISLVATIHPEEAENQNVIWSSSNKAVASVKDGEVTAVSVGEATITAKSEDGGKKATCVVTVNPKHIPVSAISLDKTEVAMNPENKEVLTATIAPENASNKSVLWSCSDESVVTVNDGEVTALKVGEVVITATSEDGGKKATCKVTVNAKPVPVTGVSLNKQKARVFINDELTLTATVAPEDATNKTLVWTTSNALVATVKNGVVKGISVGEADITVKTEDGNHSATCKVSVTEESHPITLSLSTVTSTTATFNGVLDIDMLGNYDMNAGDVGFIYAPIDQPLNIVTSSKTQISEVDAQGKFTHTLTGLKYNSEYHYAIFVYKNANCQYGESQVFETVPIDIEVGVKDITETCATISGRLTLPEQDKELEVGILCSEASDMTVATEGVQKAVVTDIMDADGVFSHRAEGLLVDNSYYYRYYVCQNDIYTYGDVFSFTTLNNPIDLSIESTATANCYIVPTRGIYKFRSVKGNSTTPVGPVASVEVLWETFGTEVYPSVGDLISEVGHQDGYIVFHTAKAFKEGNAVIAAKDKYGTILWSWHIWLTDQPQGLMYYNTAGIMMDRNLGATSVTPGDVGALGLLYQWGRKDPFLGSSSISNSSVAKSTLTWPSRVSSDSSNGTIEYATAHPTTFISYNSHNYDWYYTGSSSTDNTRWTTSLSDKSIYDPCPAGWRVPDGGSNSVWSKALDSSSSYLRIYDSTNEGMNFSFEFGNGTIWYPASGCRNILIGGLRYVGDYGYYWSASPSGNYAYSLYFNYDGSVNPSYDYYRANGQSVRCVKE